MPIVYGVDTEGEVTPLMVREALMCCFYAAHCEHSGLLESGEDVTRSYCLEILKKAFVETGGDYDSPTKQSILAVLPWLADFSKSFRDQETIKKHMGEIVGLVNLL